MGALNLLLKGLQQAADPAVARRLLGELTPVMEMVGGQIQQKGRQAARQLGLVDELTAFPSVVSQKGMNQGLLGTLDVPTKIPGQAPKPAWENVPTPPAGSRTVNTLIPQPYQGPRTRGGELAPLTKPPAPRQTVGFTEDLITPSMPTPAAPRVAEELGANLPLRQRAGAEALTEYTTSRGAVRQPGTKLGGQPYSGAPFATERNIETIASGGARAADIEAPLNIGEKGRSLFLDKGLPDMFTGEYRIDPELLRRLPPEALERFVRMGAQQTPEMSRGVRAAFGAGAGPAPMDLAADRAFEIAQALRNSAAGARTMDLSGIDPRVLLAIGGGAAATALGTGLVMRDSGEEGSAPVGELPTTGKAPELPAADLTPQPQAPGLLFGDDNGQPLAPLGSRQGEIPSSPNAITTSGGIEQEGDAMAALAQADPTAAAAARMLAPMSPEMYSSPKEYFAAREAYANKPAVREALATFAGSTGSSPEMEANLQTWAKANPALAYELQRRALANPAANQQSSETTVSSAIVTPMGSDTVSNAVGNSRAVADTAFANTQGNRDMLAATHPMELSYLQRTQSFMDNALRAARMPFA